MKRLTLILLSLLATVSAAAQLNSYFDRPKVAVVLSGGGAKGVAHISALRAIEEAGLPIDIITGTSMGALIGGLYSIGWSTDELDSLVRHQDWGFILTDRINPNAMVMALPMIGTNAKNPIHAPRPAMNRSALSKSFLLTCRYRSIHSILPILPIP